MVKNLAKKLVSWLNNDLHAELIVIRSLQDQTLKTLSRVEQDLANLVGVTGEHSKQLEHMQNVKAYQARIEENIGHVVEGFPEPPPALTGRGSALNRRR